MKRVSWIVLTIVLLTLVACSSGESEVKAASVVLCRYNQHESPKLAAFPADTAPESLIHSDDLAWLRKDDADTGGFGGLAQTITLALAPSLDAVSEGMARHTTCTVKELELSDTDARVTLTRVSPRLNRSNPMELLGELGKLDTRDARIARVEEWIAASEETNTQDVELRFVKTDAGWRARYDLEGRARRKAGEATQKELADLEAKRERLHDAWRTLNTFKVVNGTFSRRLPRFAGLKAQPVFSLAVDNATGRPVSTVHFLGVASSPGRAVPWIRETFSYTIPGGIEPGEQATWTLEPNMFSPWGTVPLPDSYDLAVHAVRLDGADGEPFASAFDPDTYSQNVLMPDAYDGKIEEAKANVVDVGSGGP